MMQEAIHIIKSYSPRTPKEINSTILEFCYGINPDSTPIYTKVFPAIGAKPNESQNNVKRYVEKNRGRAVNGWLIKEYRKCLLVAEFHVIYQGKGGRFRDITPQDEETQILFLQDNNIKNNGFKLNKKIMNISNSPVVDKIVNNMNKIFEIEMRGSFPYGTQRHLSVKDLDEIKSLEQEIGILTAYFYSNLQNNV